MAAVTICCHLKAQEEEICHCFHHFPFYLPWSNGTGCQDLSFLIFSFKLALSSSFFTLIKRLQQPLNPTRQTCLSFLSTVSNAADHSKKLHSPGSCLLKPSSLPVSLVGGSSSSHLLDLTLPWQLGPLLQTPLSPWNFLFTLIDLTGICLLMALVSKPLGRDYSMCCAVLSCSAMSSSLQPMDCSLPAGSTGSSQPRDRTQVSCIAGGFFTSWATRDVWLINIWTQIRV